MPTCGARVVGLQTNIFRSVPLSCAEIQTLNVERATCSYAGDCELLGLGLQAYPLGIAYAEWAESIVTARPSIA